jgi:hypothetical protein
MRLLNAAVNRSLKASEQHARQVRRENERLIRKNTDIEKKRGKATQKLNELYASGKINVTDFAKLKSRGAEITIDLVVFGKVAGVKLAERYVTGKINKIEFEKLRHEIITDSEIEKDELMSYFQHHLDEIKAFVQKAENSTDSATCSSCNKQKKLFTRLYIEDGLLLCGNCRKKFRSLKTFTGKLGLYYRLDSITLDVKGHNQARIKIRPEHILSF